jgi:hypothetical protein
MGNGRLGAAVSRRSPPSTERIWIEDDRAARQTLDDQRATVVRPPWQRSLANVPLA